jgi:hypothetical protein
MTADATITRLEFAICIAAMIAMLGALVSAAGRRRADRDVALSFPLPGVAAALAVNRNIPLARALLLEREFRRWFAAAAASPVMIGMGSQQVDAFWHELLWRPALYQAYSRAVCGRVLRHVEGVGGERLQARCWAAYQAVWGEYPPEEFWGPPPSAAALARVRAASAGADGGAGDGGCVFLSMSDGYSHDASCDAGGHGGGHGCGGGGHGCGGGCGGH